MLTENDVIDAVCDYLVAAGYKILRRSHTKQKGTDIIAKRPEGPGRLLIEAKGETSADPRTKGYGTPFDSAQVQVHVAEAFRTAARFHDEHHSSGDFVGVAFPDTRLHRKYLGQVKSAIDSLGIPVYFVQRDRSVKLS